MQKHLLFVIVVLLVLLSPVAHANSDDVFPAPIPGSAVKTKIVFKAPWPKDQIKPTVMSKSFLVRWDGKTIVADHSRLFPDLLLSVDVVVPAGSELSAQGGKHLKPNAPVPGKTNADLSVYHVNLPILRMSGGAIDFAVHLADGTNASFDLEYSLTLEDTAFIAHESCPNSGVYIQEGEERSNGYQGFFFARCYVEGEMLYMNILKPTDRTFTFERGGEKMLETQGQPVVRLVLPKGNKVRRTQIGEFKFKDANGHNQTFQVFFEREPVRANVGE